MHTKKVQQHSFTLRPEVPPMVVVAIQAAMVEFKKPRKVLDPRLVKAARAEADQRVREMRAKWLAE
jgi:hypothetical protein